MEKEISGIVQKNPIALERCCIFSVEDMDELYLVVSTDRQAAKDNIFVESGQEIYIRGSCLEEKKFKGIIITEKAKINIKKSIF